MTTPYLEVERAVATALATYSNVHRGSGHHSLASTRLYEQAREVVLDHLKLDRGKHLVVFCSPRRAAKLGARLAPGKYQILSSDEIGLPLGLRAVAVERKALPKGAPFEAGGGTARLISADWIIWASDPDRFEAGTPAITNVIAFARALQMIGRYGRDAFRAETGKAETETAEDPLAGCSGRELLARLRQTLIGRKVRVPTRNGERDYVNLDNAASTPTFEPIWNEVRRAWHLPRPEQAAMVEQSKGICAEVLGAPLASYDLIFTSNTTEAINLVADSLDREASAGGKRVVLGTYLEHNSNELPWRRLKNHSLVRVPLDPEGALDLAALENQLRDRARGREPATLVAVSGGSNVLGVHPPLAEISSLAHRYGARVLVDAAQLIAHRQVRMEAWGIDFLAFSAHKVYAPFGTGVLLARKGLLAFSPAEMASIRASGEENVGGIAALGRALSLLQRIGFDTIQAEESALTRQALVGLAALPTIKVHGINPSSPRLAERGPVIAFSVKSVTPSRVARELAERAGIGSRQGCHCAHILIKRLLKLPTWAEPIQHVFFTLASRTSPIGVARVSFGLATTSDEVDIFLDTLAQIVARPKGKCIGGEIDRFVEAARQAVYAPVD